MLTKLSPRLDLILKAGVRGEPFWDLCCDHGYLGEAALASQNFSHVYFVDQVPEIISKLKTRLEEPEGASFLAISAEDISQPMRGTVSVAGIGGYNMAKILSVWEERGVLQASRLLLNSMSHVEQVRAFLKRWQSYRETTTLTVMEKHRSREIIVLEPK